MKRILTEFKQGDTRDTFGKAFLKEHEHALAHAVAQRITATDASDIYAWEQNMLYHSRWIARYKHQLEIK